VFVEDGVATLIGVVNNLKASRAAANDARSVDGIWKVENHIRVRPDTERSDPALERRIEDALQLDPYLDAIEVQPTVVSGKVYLDGEVRTPFEKRHATDVVSHVAGVVEIENRLRVSDEWQWQPDFAIQRDVEQELFWNPFVDASQIHVSVEHGVVTLSGRVESWREYSLATGNAFEAGAKDVRNQLKVDYAPWFGGAG